MCGIWCYCTIKSKEQICERDLIDSFDTIQNRGPEHSYFGKVSKSAQFGQVYFGFKRLSINDVSAAGHQPFFHPTKSIAVMCNGEIYNYEKLSGLCKDKLVSTSDCEVLVWLYDMYGMKQMLQMLDGVFAIVVYDEEKKKIFAARDPYGVRPMFMGTSSSIEGIERIAFSSEMKGLHRLCDKSLEICQFTPGEYIIFDMDHGTANKKQYFDYNYRPRQEYKFMVNFSDVEKRACKQIRSSLLRSVEKRVHLTDRPIGCLLSGGLDSSLIASLVSEHFDDPKQLHTFSIGMEGGTDLEYAQKVADFIGSTHHTIVLTQEEFCSSIETIVEITESWDTTTIRASIGNYLVSKWISENTDIKVVFNGDGSDELFGGYIYFNKAPTSNDFRDECMRLLRQIHFYDGLRSDRSISRCGLEARTPFLDLELVECVMSIPGEWNDAANKKMEKYFLRRAFDPQYTNGKQYLPDEVLWRRKEAFSDGVSNAHKTTQSILQDYIMSELGSELLSAELIIPQMIEEAGSLKMEKLYYKLLFDSYYAGRQDVIPGEWLPKWCGDIKDPSARELEHYKETTEATKSQ